jgi:histidine ammonia-lyase
MLLLKVVGLCRGHSGVAEATVDRLLLLLTRGALPVVPSQGSLGASGDLAPLAHLVLPLIGVGDVMVGGEQRAARDVLAGWGLEPLVLGPKEGLALINGTQLMGAYGVESARRMHRIALAADALAALSLEAWHGRSEPFSEAIHRVRPHPGAAESARVVRSWLAGSRQQTEPRTQVQDPYSFRCVPQVHGASRDVLAHALTVLDRELQGVTDNPLVFPETGEILSGGNFHGQPLALTLEAMALATHEWASISERRTFKLLAGRQGLPPFLAAEPGLNSGLMIPQYTAASLVSQNKQLCTPAAADTIDSSNGQEDHVSMGANSALKLWRILDNAEQVLAIECLAAACLSCGRTPSSHRIWQQPSTGFARKPTGTRLRDGCPPDHATQQAREEAVHVRPEQFAAPDEHHCPSPLHGPNHPLRAHLGRESFAGFDVHRALARPIADHGVAADVGADEPRTHERDL